MHILDSTWSAGNLSGSTFKFAYNEHYWLTEPRMIIFDHFPAGKGLNE